MSGEEEEREVNLCVVKTQRPQVKTFCGMKVLVSAAQKQPVPDPRGDAMETQRNSWIRRGHTVATLSGHSMERSEEKGSQSGARLPHRRQLGWGEHDPLRKTTGIGSAWVSRAC